MQIDTGNTKTIRIAQFREQCDNIGIQLTSQEFDRLYQLYKKSEAFIDYDIAIQNIVPQLSKNNDTSIGYNFKVGWSLSKTAKMKGL